MKEFIKRVFFSSVEGFLFWIVFAIWMFTSSLLMFALAIGLVVADIVRVESKEIKDRLDKIIGMKGGVE